MSYGHAKICYTFDLYVFEQIAIARMAVVAGFEKAEESTLDTFVDIVQNCRTLPVIICVGHSNQYVTLELLIHFVATLSDVETVAREASERAIRRGKCIAQ